MAKKHKVGRKPNWFREKCADIIVEENMLDFVKRVAKGDESEERMTKYGGIVQVKASIDSRMGAVKFLAEYAVGKPVQAVTGPDGGPLTVTVVSYAGAK